MDSQTRIGTLAATVRKVAPRAMMMMIPWFAMSPALAQQPTMALWKAQEINFSYSSTTSIYSCGALEARVESLLRAVGADQVKASASGCSDFLFPSELPSVQRSGVPGIDQRFARRNQFSQLAFVRIRFRSPIEATPDAIAELDKTKGYRELLGRVTGSSAAIQEAASQFPTQREQVTLSNRTIGLRSEECELVEQMIAEVFPKLGVRVVKQSITCFPHQVSLLTPRLEVEALIKTPESTRPPDAAGSPAAAAPPAATDPTVPSVPSVPSKQ
jgi:hypothetical protein